MVQEGSPDPDCDLAIASVNFFPPVSLDFGQCVCQYEDPSDPECIYDDDGSDDSDQHLNASR